MHPKLLTKKDYFQYFNTYKSGTVCGIEREPGSGENYFYVQTFLPKNFFITELQKNYFNPFFGNIIDVIPDHIQVKFELFGIGEVDGLEAFIFKPWVVNINDPNIYNILENFNLFFPSTLFYHLISGQIFIENLDPKIFNYIRVLQDISENTFDRFGLNRETVPKELKVENFEIKKIVNIDSTEISAFYEENWLTISPKLATKYFDPTLNSWFRIIADVESRKFFGLTRLINKKTIGFLRIYNTANSFNGGGSIEYIIEKDQRNLGYASKSVHALIEYIKKYSFAIFIGAEVNDDNHKSKAILKKFGFKETTTDGISDDNYELSIINNLDELEHKNLSIGIDFKVVDYYFKKYKRFF